MKTIYGLLKLGDWTGGVAVERATTRITSGALMGLGGRIKNTNCHKREAVVEMRITGATREVAVILEILEKQGAKL